MRALRVLSAVVVVAAVAVWGVGVWQLVAANTVAGAVMVLAGGGVAVGIAAWRLRAADEGAQGIGELIAGFLSRNP